MRLVRRKQITPTTAFDPAARPTASSLEPTVVVHAPRAADLVEPRQVA